MRRMVQQGQGQALVNEAVQEFQAIAQKEAQRKEYRQRLTQALEAYDVAYAQLAHMYQGKAPLSIKKAVFTVENTFLENTFSYHEYSQQISQMVSLCQQQIHPAKRTKPSQDDKHLALYQFFCDTTYVYGPDQSLKAIHYPFVYDFEDYCGEQDHRQVFVTKLMATNTGQCHSLPLLYKILADEMKVEAFISTAPSHTYVQHRDQRGNWYHLELTAGRYVTEANMMNFGYIKAAALKNKIYMDTLSRRQTIGMCLMDLALGYEAKFGSLGNDHFVVQCCDLVFATESNNVQALMVKANVINRRLAAVIQTKGIQSVAEIPNHPQAHQLYQQRESLYARIDQLGYVPMPKEKYEAWLASLTQEKQNRHNQNSIPPTKNN